VWHSLWPRLRVDHPPGTNSNNGLGGENRFLKMGTFLNIPRLLWRADWKILMDFGSAIAQKAKAEPVENSDGKSWSFRWPNRAFLAVMEGYWRCPERNYGTCASTALELFMIER